MPSDATKPPVLPPICHLGARGSRQHAFWLCLALKLWRSPTPPRLAPRHTSARRRAPAWLQEYLACVRIPAIDEGAEAQEPERAARGTDRTALFMMAASCADPSAGAPRYESAAPAAARGRGRAAPAATGARGRSRTREAARAPAAGARKPTAAPTAARTTARTTARNTARLAQHTDTVAQLPEVAPSAAPRPAPAERARPRPRIRQHAEPRRAQGATQRSAALPRTSAAPVRAPWGERASGGQGVLAEKEGGAKPRGGAKPGAPGAQRHERARHRRGSWDAADEQVAQLPPPAWHAARPSERRRPSALGGLRRRPKATPLGPELN